MVRCRDVRANLGLTSTSVSDIRPSTSLRDTQFDIIFGIRSLASALECVAMLGNTGSTMYLFARRHGKAAVLFSSPMSLLFMENFEAFNQHWRCARNRTVLRSSPTPGRLEGLKMGVKVVMGPDGY